MRVGVLVALVAVSVVAIGAYVLFRPAESPGTVRRVDRSLSIESVNMAPTLRQKDRVGTRDAVDGPLTRGDIVLLHPPGEADREKTVIQRVVGVPGDFFEIRDGRVVLGERTLDEPYVEQGVVTGPVARFMIPAATYFVMGDNRGNSRDSRFFGPVARRDIVAVVTSILAPKSRARSLQPEARPS